MRKIFLAALLTSLLVLPGPASVAQISNYWNQQYGTRSTLLGGAVIGSVSDMSATYYNPGAISLFEEDAILLSARGYEYSAQRIKNGAGDGRDLTSSKISPLPDLVASSLPFDWLGEQALAFSILVRSRGNSAIQARGPVSPTSPGGTADTELILFDDMSEFWGGLTYSTRLSDRIGVGVTTYLAVRDQDRRSQLLAQEIMANGDIAASILINHQTYMHARLLWKAGIGINLSPLTLGATITTPGVGLFGTGSSLVNSTSTGFDFDGDGMEDNILAGSYQSDVDADYRSSWSYGAGASYSFGDVKVHVSGEYIDGVDFFRILDTEDFVAQSSGDTISSHLTHEAEPVFNYAFGLEVLMGEKTKAYVSFSTDFSAGIQGSRSTLSIAKQDIFHIGGGAAFVVGRWDLIAGAVYAFGQDKLEDVFRAADVGGLASSLSGSDVTFQRIRVLFGFSFRL
ncbi:MAG: hypothetical protein OEV30_02205 [Ignavibacteria bacterium]|nr:hypothetical protein [Ignavibacteria bacterium]